jgi:hypothetical protein
MRVNHPPKPSNPLDTLLGRAVERAQDPVVRDWLRALLEEGERAESKLEDEGKHADRSTRSSWPAPQHAEESRR